MSIQVSEYGRGTYFKTHIMKVGLVGSGLSIPGTLQTNFFLAYKDFKEKTALKLGQNWYENQSGASMLTSNSSRSYVSAVLLTSVKTEIGCG